MRASLVGGGVAAALLMGLFAFDGLKAQSQEGGMSTLRGPVKLSDTPPVSEGMSGVAGTQDEAARQDHTHPRISRSAVVTTGTNGVFSGTWANPMQSNPVIVLTPVSAGTSVDCQLTAAPTTTGFQGRCFQAQTSLLNLSIITAGLTLNPVANSPAGMQVHVLAIPSSQQ